LNNLIEQDNRNVKFRTNVMLGFKRFRNAAITLAGIELMHRIRKDQFNLVKLSLKDTAAPLCGMPSCWLDKISLVMRNT
jgi:transposase-like protein